MTTRAFDNFFFWFPTYLLLLTTVFPAAKKNLSWRHLVNKCFLFYFIWWTSFLPGSVADCSSRKAPECWPPAEECCKWRRPNQIILHERIRKSFINAKTKPLTYVNHFLRWTQSWSRLKRKLNFPSKDESSCAFELTKVFCNNS